VAGVDVFNVLDRGGSKRYLIMLVPIAVVLTTRVHRRTLYVRPHQPDGQDHLRVWLMA